MSRLHLYRLLAVTDHPDNEARIMGGTSAKCAAQPEPIASRRARARAVTRIRFAEAPACGGGPERMAGLRSAVEGNRGGPPGVERADEFFHKT